MRQSVTRHHTMKPPSPVGNGENYLSFDSHRDLMPVPLLLAVGQDAVRGGLTAAIRCGKAHLTVLSENVVIMTDLKLI